MDEMSFVPPFIRSMAMDATTRSAIKPRYTKTNMLISYGMERLKSVPSKSPESV